MPFGINNPLPSSMRSAFFPNQSCTITDSIPGECKKAAATLASFVDPRQAFGPDKVIPPEVLANAKVPFPYSLLIAAA